MKKKIKVKLGKPKPPSTEEQKRWKKSDRIESAIKLAFKEYSRQGKQARQFNDSGEPTGAWWEMIGAFQCDLHDHLVNGLREAEVMSAIQMEHVIKDLVIQLATEQLHQEQLREVVEAITKTARYRGWT